MKKSQYQIYSTSKQAWGAMCQAISGAKKSIYWELYIFIDDEVGKPFFDILEKKAKEGLDVKLVVDYFGSFWLSRKTAQELRRLGVDLVFFQERKYRYRGWWRRMVSRTHRKILVVDEKIGFIGGVNIQKHMKDWLDITVRLEGKVVHSLLRAFAKSYVIAGGDKKKVRRLLKYKFRVDQDEVDLVLDDSHAGYSKARKKYLDALLKARERVILFSPYYFPDKKFLYALWKARKRGVKVDLLIPFRGDLVVAKYAAYAWFSVMRKYGVNVHWTDKMMHGKGVIVDDDWAMIGSSNIEPTSFYDNYEANVQIRDKKFVKDLKETMRKWIRKSSKLKDEEWKKRSKGHKFKEWLAMKLYKLWHRRYKK